VDTSLTVPRARTYGKKDSAAAQATAAAAPATAAPTPAVASPAGV
jgi:hypothetical protein